MFKDNLQKAESLIYKKFFILLGILILCTIISICFIGIFSINAISDIQFTHGVASGDVTSDSAVLWTRINQDGVVKVEVSENPDFKKTVFTKAVHAKVDDDFTVKVIAKGLEKDHKYYYRWIHDDAIS
jgi:phosphodiesterase/alkaline phosphatase D-like protein